MISAWGVLGTQRGFLAYLNDVGPFVGYGAVLVIALPLAVAGDQSAIGH